MAKKRWIAAAAACVAILTIVVRASWPAPPVTLKVSRETTFLTGPLNPDGTVNYVAARNARLGKGVTPKNNAAIPIIRALGPDGVSGDTRDAVLAQLGLAGLPANGEYVVELRAYWQRTHGQPRTRRGRFKLPRAVWETRDDPWEAETVEPLAGWIEANKTALDLLVSASKRERFFVPLISSSSPPSVVDGSFGHSFKLSLVSKALACRAVLSMENGDLDATQRDALAMHHLGRLLAQDTGLMTYALGCQMEIAASRTDIAMARAEGLTGHRARAILSDVTALPEWPGTIGILNYGERFLGLDSVSAVLRGKTLGSKVPSKLDPNVLFGTVNGWYDRLEEACLKRSFLGRRKAMRLVKSDLDKAILQQSQRYKSLSGILKDFSSNCTS